jgi:hypothetical protein
MFRKRQRRNDRSSGPRPNSPPAVAAPDSPKPSQGAAGVDRETRTQPVLTDAFKGAIEKAADRAKIELASKGKIKPMAFFAYGDGTLKMVSLALRGGQQKEEVIRRIREKVIGENAFAVITLSEVDHERPGMLLSGVTSGARVSARVDYGFDKETKVVTSWKMNWLNQPVQNVFLDGIFDKTG